MNPIETVLYSVAEPTQGLFPTELIAQALQQSLVQIECVISDWPQSMRDQLEESKAIGEVADRGYRLRLAEIHRNQKESGETPIMEIEGFDADGFRLWFRVSEKFISAGFREAADMDEEKARDTIPRIKRIISGVFPNVMFKDVTNRRIEHAQQ